MKSNFTLFFQNIKPQNAFIILALIYGFLLLVITPPFQVPDEFNHMKRAYQISNLEFIGQRQEKNSGGNIPTNFVNCSKPFDNLAFYPENKITPEKIIKTINLKNQATKKTFSDFRNTVIYFPFGYIPQSLGILTGKSINASPVLLLYFARVFNFLCSIFLIYFAIRKTPLLKWGMFLLALMPMTLSELASASYDSLTIGLSFFLCAVFLNYAYEKKKIDNKDITIMLALSILMSLTKLAYFPLILLYLLIPKKKFSSNKIYYLLFTILTLSSIWAIMLWSYFMKACYVPLSTPTNINPYLQINYIFQNPIAFGQTLLNTFYHSYQGYIREFVGILGYLDTPLPQFIVYPYFGILLLSPLIDSEIKIKSLKNRVMLGGTFFLNLITMCTLLYLSSSPYKADYVTGIQGRYFIPFFYCLMLMLSIKFKGKSYKFFTKYKSEFFILVSIITLSTTIFCIIQRYYIF